MLRNAAVLAGVVLSITGALPQVAGSVRQDAARGSATLAGSVFLAATDRSAPIRRARVVAQREGGSSHTTDTDVDGRFLFGGLPAGTYRIHVDKAGFVPVDPLRRPTPAPTIIAVADGQPATVQIPMQRGAAIEGRLVRETGEPAVNIVVSAVRLTYGPYGAQPSAIRQSRTDDRGRFRVHTLPPGEYYVHAEPDPIDVLTRSIPGDPSPGLARSYYPGTPRVAEARRVSLDTGEERTNVDFRIASVPTALVSGRVVHSSGAKPAAISIRLQRVGGPPGEVRGILSPPPDGFEFSVVPPGDYWLLAASRAAPGGSLEFAAQRLSVSGQPHKDLRVNTASGASCTGHIEVDGARVSVPRGASVVARQTEFELPLPAGVQPATVAHAPIDPNGAFAFSSLFGPRVLRLDRQPDTWALQEVRLDDVEITDAPVDFKGTDRQCALRLLVTARTAAISGTVQDERGQPIASARVVIFPDNLQRRGSYSRFVKTVETGPDGRFDIRGLLPERYRITAVDYVDEGAWNDLETLSRLQALSVARVLAADERAAVVLTMRLLR